MTEPVDSDLLHLTPEYQQQIMEQRRESAQNAADQERYRYEHRSLDPHNTSDPGRGYTKAEMDALFRQLQDSLALAGVLIPFPQLPEPFRNQVDMPFNA